MKLNSRSVSKLLFLVVTITAMVVILAACSSTYSSPTPTSGAASTPYSSGATSATPSRQASPTETASANTVNISNKTGIGDYLVDGKGMTLYFWGKDSPGKSTTTGQVLTNWPLFNPGNFVVPSGLNASDFGTITRDDGLKVATYKNWPLYYFINDKAAGDTNGNGVNNFSIINPANFPPTPTGSATTPAASTATANPPAANPPAAGGGGGATAPSY